ncbi:Uncharacterised protein [Mycobacterium tuberculosis]|nr:Uncharacterised protein [Mycobacterium tuberculosis]
MAPLSAVKSHSAITPSMTGSSLGCTGSAS